MSSYATITLNSIPYGTQDITSGVARWMDRSGGSPFSFGPLTFSVGNPGGQSPVQRVTWKLRIPIAVAEDSACGCTGTIDHESAFEVLGVIAKSSSLAERTDLLARLRALVLTDQFEKSFLNLEFVS